MTMNFSLNGSRNIVSNGEMLPWNNPANIITYDMYVQTVYYYNIVMKPPLDVLGVSLNVINCLVFRRQGLRDRMNLCLFILALVDLAYLGYSVIFAVVITIRMLAPALGEEVHMKVHYYAMSIDYGLREASACVSVVIAVERCVCVVFPLRANSLMTTRTMASLLVVIVISMQLAFITTPFKKYVYPVYDNATGITKWTVTRSPAWQESEALLLYDELEDAFMMVGFPFLAITVVTGATVITVVKLRAAVSWRGKASSTRSEVQGKQVALTKILVLVSSAFIACKFPWAALTLAQIFYPEFSPFGSQCNIFRVFELVAHYFLYCHSCLNFFIYYSRSSSFRLHLRHRCGCSLKPVKSSTKTSLNRLSHKP